MVSCATVCAIATPPAPGGIGILRVSGTDALAATVPLAARLPSSPAARHAYFTPFTDRAGEPLDEGLFLFFAAPHSFTGEDVVELHAHGGPELLGLLQREVLKDERVRAASAGEFTRRAFLNGRLDLARAEAVAALIAAESEAAVRAAAAQLGGALSEKVRAVRSPLLQLQVDVEGALNFPDEAMGVDAEVRERLEPLRQELLALLAQAERGRLIRRQPRVVLFGPTNGGKSTLFNCLLGEDRALVDEEPGTTRDALEARVQWSGAAIALVDTAGLRAGASGLEARGIARAQAAVAHADLAVLLIPPHSSEAEIATWRSAAQAVPLLEVEGKADAVSIGGSARRLRVSGKSGAGVALLREEIGRRLWGASAPQATCVSAERHREALARAASAVERALQAGPSALDALAGELGVAVGALGQVTGESANGELLDAIFREFCIGK